MSTSTLTLVPMVYSGFANSDHSLVSPVPQVPQRGGFDKSKTQGRRKASTKPIALKRPYLRLERLSFHDGRGTRRSSYPYSLLSQHTPLRLETSLWFEFRECAYDAGKIYMLLATRSNRVHAAPNSAYSNRGGPPVSPFYTLVHPSIRLHVHPVHAITSLT